MTRGLFSLMASAINQQENMTPLFIIIPIFFGLFFCWLVGLFQHLPIIDALSRSHQCFIYI